MLVLVCVSSLATLILSPQRPLLEEHAGEISEQFLIIMGHLHRLCLLRMKITMCPASGSSNPHGGFNLSGGLDLVNLKIRGG